MLDFKISLVFALLTFGLLTVGMEFKSENLAYGSSKFDDAMDKITRDSEKAQDKMEEIAEETEGELSEKTEKAADIISENAEDVFDTLTGNNNSEISKPYADCIFMYNQNVSITLKTDDDCNKNDFEDAVEYYKLDEFPIEKTDRELGNAKMIELVRGNESAVSDEK